RDSINPIQNLAQKFKIVFSSRDRFLQPIEELLFAFVTFLFRQAFMKHDPLFQFANRSPECAFECFGMFFAQAFRRKSMSHETFELHKLTVLELVHGTVALWAGERNLIAWRLGGRMIRCCLLLRTHSSI